jgi:hypothetical protein
VRHPSRCGYTTALALVAVCLALLPTCTSAQTPPDLVIEGIALVPAVARPGDVVTALVTVRNVGDAPAAPSTVGLHLTTSKDAPLDVATALGALTVNGLASDAAVQLPLSFTVPEVAPGYLYVVARADTTGILAEASEGNNRRTRRLEVTRPDLAVSGLSLSPAAARAGDTVTLDVTVRNAGRVPAHASSVGIYFAAISGSPIVIAKLFFSFAV